MIYNPQRAGSGQQFVSLDRYASTGADAFNNALDEVRPGGAIFIPPGDWVINRFHIQGVKSGIKIFGTGASSKLTWINPGVTFGSFLRISANDCELKNFWLDVNDDTSITGNSEGLQINGSRNLFERLTITNASSDG